VWTNEEESQEEVRAKCSRYSARAALQQVSKLELLHEDLEARLASALGQ
jgi:hypothetical protein